MYSLQENIISLHVIISKLAVMRLRLTLTPHLSTNAPLF